MVKTQGDEFAEALVELCEALDISIELEGKSLETRSDDPEGDRAN